MKKVKFIILLCIYIFPFIVNAESMNAINYVQKLADDAGGDKNSVNIIGNTSLAYDGTADNNLRYVGNNPNNYVLFNNELWRIIGLMNNVIDSNGNPRTRLKIINTNYFEMSFDVGNSTIFSTSTMMKEFNPGYEEEGFSNYWNNTGQFEGKGLTEVSRRMIDEATWYNGHDTTQWGSQYPYAMYERIRSRDEIKFVTKVGIIEPSDIGFASGDTDDIRNSCINTNMFFWNYSSYAECNPHNYFYVDNNHVIGTIMRDDDDEMFIYRGFVSANNAFATSNTKKYPTLYLKEDVLILSGDGTHDNPYVLKLNNKSNINVENDEKKGKIDLDSINNVEEGSKVQFAININQGYKLVKLEIKDLNDNIIEYTVEGNNYSFIMPETDITITPIYEEQKIVNPKTGNKILIAILVIITIIIISGFIYTIKEYRKEN